MDAFGWSWEYIDEEMTLPRMAAISKHWEQVPPISITLASIASALGVKKAEKADVQQDMSALMADMGGMLTGGKPEWLTE